MKIPVFVQGALQGGIDSLARAGRWAFNLRDDWHVHRDMAQNNYELGLLHLARGNFSDAIFRFKITTWMAPKNALAWYGLGRAYLGEGKRVAAVAAFKKSTALAPASEETAYMMAVAIGVKAAVDRLPGRMPLSLSLEHFEGLAENYDDEQLNNYGYLGHVQLADALRAALPAGRVDNALLDLGVGTGLSGARLRDVAGRLVGVDFSPKMLAEAKKLQSADGQPVYDELVLKEVGAFLPEVPAGMYDGVLAGGLLSYIGDVHSLMVQVARVLKTGGVFGFTVDGCDGEGYRFLPEAGRFGFSENYVRQLAGTAALNVATLTQVEIYPGYKAWLCVLSN